jgi:hypothetical protein
MNPLLAHAASEHGVLAGKGRAVEFFRGTGWLKGYRSLAGFEADTKAHLALAERFGVRYEIARQPPDHRSRARPRAGIRPRRLLARHGVP